MQLPRWLFEAERAALLLSLLLLWPAFLSQLLVWRFTPKKKWNQTKVRCRGVNRGLQPHTARSAAAAARWSAAVGIGMAQTRSERPLCVTRRVPSIHRPRFAFRMPLRTG